MKRTFIRVLGSILSIFVSGRANATTLFYDVACPSCDYKLIGSKGYICDTNVDAYGERIYTYDAGSMIEMMCIEEASSIKINNSGCVSKLKNWGMCSGVSINRLATSGLTCANAVTGFSGNYSTTYCGYTYTSVSGATVFGKTYIAFESTNMPGSTFDYISCDLSSGVCCLTSSGSSFQIWVCGVCVDPSTYQSGITESLTISQQSSAGCSAEFQEYFGNTQLSTGYCSGNTIFVEGTGALLIANECFGETGYSSTLNLPWVCGLILDSCNVDSGYYYVETTSGTGISDYCQQCPEAWVSGFEFTYTAGTGISSCVATPTVQSFSHTDGAGTFTMGFGDEDGNQYSDQYNNCTYTE